MTRGLKNKKKKMRVKRGVNSMSKRGKKNGNARNCTPPAINVQAIAAFAVGLKIRSIVSPSCHAR